MLYAEDGERDASVLVGTYGMVKVDPAIVEADPDGETGWVIEVARRAPDDSPHTWIVNGEGFSDLYVVPAPAAP